MNNSSSTNLADNEENKMADNPSTTTSTTTEEDRGGHHLSLIQKLAISMGHVFNDLCAAFWFTYLLIFMHFVNQFNSNTSGTLMLVGQVADGLATPFVGIECDRRLDWFFCKYGRRKCWHLIGTLCVFLSFPFLFNQCIGCANSPENSQMIYYAAFITIFQFGWASVQISHLSLIPASTPSSSERIELNSYRYAFTVFANIAVYILMWLLLKTNDEEDGSQISPNDASTFRNVAFIIIAIGSVFSLIFHLGTRERNTDNDDEIRDQEQQQQVSTISTNEKSVECRVTVWHGWFQQIRFYKVALLYMGTRLTINLTQVYIPNYLQETLRLPKKSVAYIPLVTYTSGFVTSFLMKYINQKLGKKITFLIGAILSLGACTWIYFGTNEGFKQWGIFVVSIIIGASNSIMLITSLGITNDLIGKNTASGSFVFGAMSFVDKVSNGLAVWLIEHFKPCATFSCIICDYYYRDILTFVCGGATALAIASLALMLMDKKKKLSLMNEHPTSTTIAAATIIDPNLTPISGENIIDDDDEPNLLTPLLNNNRSTRR
ncbi:major facilitator superfamily domain-containing protein 12-like [Dermatophagoides pteronyssinus]|uniref:major facilitator superfamily domain-containing protein 12-like n=1 Tax=Dermatophagoides pteronyssinus TaxID=6956 RepID=UPI003F678B3F